MLRGAQGPGLWGRSLVRLGRGLRTNPGGEAKGLAQDVSYPKGRVLERLRVGLQGCGLQC